VITRVAGTTGTAGFGGDGGPATDAELYNPVGLAVTGDGGFLITGGIMVRKVSADGVITRVAGTDNAGSGAMTARPPTPSSTTAGLAVTADGGFLIADTANQVVRKVSADGVITRVAGTTGTAGSGGDDGPATGAELNYPEGVAVTADGGFLIADAVNQVVRKVEPSG